MKQTKGYVQEPYHFKDFSHEKAYGAPVVQPLLPLNTDISGVPIVFQGTHPTCVSATASWIKSFLELDKPALSWTWLAQVSGTTNAGVQPSKVFEVARQLGIGVNDAGLHAEEHKLGSYFYVKPNPQAIYSALKISKVVALGLTDWQGAGPHFVAAYDVTSDGLRWKCANWDSALHQSTIEVPFDLVDDCISFGEKPPGTASISVPLLEVLLDKTLMLPLFKKILVGVFAAGVAIFAGFSNGKYGAAGVPGEYSTQLAQAITSSATSIPAISRTLFTGETFSDSDLFHPIVIAVGKGSTREYDSCGFFNTTGTFPTFTNCLRGISALATSTAITVVPGAAFSHTAGESVSITNQPAYYQNFVDIVTAQTVSGIKTFNNQTIFNTIPSVSSTTALPTTNNQLVTKYYADTVVSTGFTAANIDATKGLKAAGSSPEKVQINASSTGSLKFDGTTGAAYVSVSSTASDTLGGYLKHTFVSAFDVIYWDAVTFLSTAHTWSGTETFNGNVTSTANLDVTTAPSTGSDVVNKTYADNQIFFGQATGTAQVAITAGNALWMSATSSQIMVTNSGNASSTYQFIGIAANSVSAGAVVTYTKPGGINCNQSGLTTGISYYLNGAAGQISSTPGTLSARIGIPTSATCIQVISPKFIATGFFTMGGSVTGASTTNIGFYANHLELRAGCVGATNFPIINGSISIGDETNTSVSFGYDGTNYQGGGDISTAVRLYCASVTTFLATISSRTNNSFVVTSSVSPASAVKIEYTAYSE